MTIKRNRMLLGTMISTVALAAALGAPAAFAEDGHGGGGHDGDRDRAVVTTPNGAPMVEVRHRDDVNDVDVNDNDVNDDRGVHMVAPPVIVRDADDKDAFDDND